jgi:hypothetical protein
MRFLSCGFDAKGQNSSGIQESGLLNSPAHRESLWSEAKRSAAARHSTASRQRDDFLRRWASNHTRPEIL